MRRIDWLAGMTVLAVTAAAALADEPDLLTRVTEDIYVEPGVPGGGSTPLIGMAVAVLMVIAVLGVSLMPSKRGHQD
ncbi:MAG: hypothetical protein QF733_07705 [Phycisphaerales bacterium]|jgi:hypothetical protein|nr:hypothetical protein [Phycisphaerales bacterium]